VQRRIEAALGLERFVMGGMGRVPTESPGDLVAEVEAHVRALLRDVLCGYLDPDLKSVADDILLETSADPPGEISARDLRRARRREAEVELEDEWAAPGSAVAGEEAEPSQDVELEYEAGADADTSEIEPVGAEPRAEPPPAEPPPADPAPVQQQLDGVTQSADWGWGDAEDYSAPV
jgi:hypothetical protein